MTLKQEVQDAERTKVRKRVFKMLQSLYTLFRGSAPDVQIIDQYMKIWKPKKARNEQGEEVFIADVLIWPYEGRKNNPRRSKKKNARCCLYCLVTECLKAFHKYHANPDVFEGDLHSMLTEIESIIAAKLEIPIEGSDVTGFYFRKKISKPPKRKKN